MTALIYLVTNSMFLCEQMVLALRYLHKEKGILHRDLTPNNIMLGEDDKVTISKSLSLSSGVWEGDGKVTINKSYTDS